MIVNGDPLEGLEEFTYCGSVMSKDNREGKVASRKLRSNIEDVEKTINLLAKQNNHKRTVEEE